MVFIFFVFGFIIGHFLNALICSYCSQKGNYYYPIVELLTGVVFYLILQKFSFSVQSISYLVLAAIAIVASFIDLSLQIIPNKLVLFGLIIGLLINIIGNTTPLASALIGFIFGGAIMLLFYLISGGNIGGGDIKFIIMIAFFIGWQKIFLVIFLSFVIGALVSLLLLLSGKKKLKDPIPFGPFISLGTLLVINWSYDMAKWYLQLYN